VRDEDAPSYDAEPPTVPKRGAFGMIPWELYDRLEGDGDAQATLLALLRHSNEKGECWPSVATICKKTGKSDKHVRVKIDKLVSLGILTKEPRRTGGMKSVNVYRICQKTPEVKIGMEYRTFGSGNRTDRYGVPDSAVPGTDRTRTSELEPKELQLQAHEKNGTNGHAPPVPHYRETIGEPTWAAVSAQFKRVDPSLSSAWFSGTMADAEVKFGEASRAQLEEAVKITLSEVERRVKTEQTSGKLVGNLKSWCRAVFESNLRDAMGVAR